MIRIGIHSLLIAALVVLAAPLGLRAETKAETAPAPEFNEVYDSVRAHLAGMSEAELNRAAVQGFISALGPRVSLVTSGATAKPAADALLVSKSSLMDEKIAYVRIETVGEGLAKAVRGACQKVAGTNQLKGVVLDLRFARGDDYAAAAGTADLFLKKELPLLNWGSGVARSKEKTDAISVPVAVLVNRFTVGAAEALAAVMRETGTGLILGGTTAGQAMIAQEFPLKNGDRLRVATVTVRLGDGTALSWQGIKPDIAVQVSLADDRAYYADAFKASDRTDLAAVAGLSLTNQAGVTNRSARGRRMNEAELLRERREGLSEADLAGLRNREPDQPQVQDPALARALDLLKGLAVVRQGRS